MTFPCQNNHQFDDVIKAAAASFNISPALLKSHVNRESSFQQYAYRSEPNVNDASYGLSQIRFHIAQALGYPGDRVGLYDAGTNLYLAAKLISQNIAQARGQLDVAISAYNAGFDSANPHDAKRTSDGSFVNAGYVNDVLHCIPAYQADFNAATTTQQAPSNGVTSYDGVGGISPVVVGLGVLALITALYFLLK